MKLRAPVLAFALALVSSAYAEPSADNAQASWGKVDVSFDEYREDAMHCTMLATITVLGETPSNIMMTPDASVDQIGLSEALSNLGAAGLAGTIRHRVARLAIVEHCLRNRGYTEFLLTREQRAHLRTLEHGSPERHRYLYSLATDPDVLANQAM